jgi:deoxyribonuclease-4
LDELLRAHAYGIPHVVLHPGSHVGAGEVYGIARIAAALNRIHALAPQCANTVTCLELMAGQGNCLGRSLEQLRAIIDLVDEPQRVGVCLDTCHAYATGYDLRTAAGYAEFMLQVEQVLGLETVKVWHFNDSKGALGSSTDRHMHIGEGTIGADGFAYVLNDPRWAGTAMLLETPKEDNLVEDIENLKRLCLLVDDPRRIPPGLLMYLEAPDPQLL